MSKYLMEQSKKIMINLRKTILSILVICLLGGAVSAGAYAMFRVSGVVTKVDNNSITVANFFRTQTVDLTGSPVNVAEIKPGDKIKILKNIEGNVLYARTSTSKESEHEDDD